MKTTVKHGMVFLLAGILTFFPFVAFAQEAGEVTGEEMVTESQAESSKGAKVGLENPDPTSSPLSEKYEHPVSPHKPPGWEKGKKKGWGESEVPPGWEN